MKRLIALAAALLSACAPAAAGVPLCGYKVQQVYPHDPQAFTEGLFFRDGFLFESTGLEGRSTIRKLGLDGTVVKQATIPPALFGEGIVDWGKEIVSVTWRTGVGFRWRLDTLEPTGRFTYPGEGWGLTQDGRSIIMSDGTPTLRFRDPLTMRELRSLAVTADGKPVVNLNELEWMHGEILANVWQTDRIARIDPATGRVKAWIDLTGLRAAAAATGADDVLNGIAYDRKTDRLFVTGKNWSKLFRITLTDGAVRAGQGRPTACPPVGG